METLVIYADTKADLTKIKEAIKLMRRVKSVSEKLTLSDIERLAEANIFKEIEKSEQSELISYKQAKKEFARLREKLIK